MDESRAHRLHPWVVLAILLVAVVLRCAGLAREVPWHDEVLSLRYIDAPNLPNYLEEVLGNDEGVKPFPVYFVLQYLWSAIFGPSVISLRLLSVACSIGALIFLIATARRLYSHQAAWIAGALFAVSLPHIYFAQEIRFYALVTFMVSISCYCFVRAVQTNRATWWACNILVNVLLPWTHIYSALIWLPQVIALLAVHLRNRKLLAVWTLAHTAIAIAFGVWIFGIIRYVIEDEYVRQATPTYRELLNAYNVYAGGRFSKLNPALYLPTGFSFDRVLTILMGLLTLAVIALHRSRHEDENEKTGRFPIVFILAWLIAPPLLLFVVSVIWKPLFVFRYTLYASLAWYIIAGAAYSSLKNKPARALIAALLIAIFAHQLTVLAQPFRPDFIAADNAIQQASSNDAMVFILKRLNGIPYRYHSALPPDRIVVEEGLGELLAAIDAHLETNSTAWIILWQWNDFETIEGHFQDRKLNRREYPGIPALIVYRIDV